MSDYQSITGLEFVYLEDSYVLDIEAHPTTLKFEMDLVLTPEHPGYIAPRSDQNHCYRRGRIEFTDITQYCWTGQGSPPATDATGEVDYGNIDSFTREPDAYTLEGDWGRLMITARQITVSLT